MYFGRDKGKPFENKDLKSITITRYFCAECEESGMEFGRDKGKTFDKKDL
jgi:hypothetical protein